MPKGFYKIDGLEINPDPCCQSQWERGLVRGAIAILRKIFPKITEKRINQILMQEIKAEK